MPEQITHWDCDTCHKRYTTYNQAEFCESQHIVDSAASKFSEQMKIALAKLPKFPVKYRPISDPKTKLRKRKAARTKGSFD